MLDAERIPAPGASPSAPPEAPEAQPPAGALACGTCGAEMAPEQDWCLNCGAAAPGRLGERPGWRAFSTIAALTLLLVLGAAAASYAALSSHKREPAWPPPRRRSRRRPARRGPAGRPGHARARRHRRGKEGRAAQGQGPRVLGRDQHAGQAGDHAQAEHSTTSAPRSTPSTPTTTTPKTPNTTKPTAPVAIKLDPGAGSTYDPSGRAAATGDAAKALDGDSSTSWYLDPSATDGPIGAGYAINLGRQRAVKRIELTTTTPGFRVEVYATDEATPPPDITDTRWSHITNVSNVGSGSGTQTIVVGGGTSKYQTVLLWITDRPSDGARVRISELKLLG